MLDKDGSPALGRCQALLKRLEKAAASWGVSSDDERKLPIRLAPVFSGLDDANVLAQLSKIWPSVSVAAKKGAIMAGRKGPATWLRYGQFGRPFRSLKVDRLP